MPVPEPSGLCDAICTAALDRYKRPTRPADYQQEVARTLPNTYALVPSQCQSLPVRFLLSVSVGDGCQRLPVPARVSTLEAISDIVDNFARTEDHRSKRAASGMSMAMPKNLKSRSLTVFKAVAVSRCITSSLVVTRHDSGRRPKNYIACRLDIDALYVWIDTNGSSG